MKLGGVPFVYGVFLSFSWVAGAQVDVIFHSESHENLRSALSKSDTSNLRFPTLQQAVAWVKKELSGSSGVLQRGGVTIRLLPGRYRLPSPIVLEKSESGRDGGQLSIVGPADKTAVISGGIVLKEPMKIRNPSVLERLPRKSREFVVQFDLRAEQLNEWGSMIRRGSGQSIGPGQLELFYRGQPMPLARWPNREYAVIQAEGTESGAKRSFTLPGANVKNLAREPALMAIGYWAKDWADETLPVESVDSQTGVITLRSPGPRLGITSGQRVFLQNALSELDQPGEWYLDGRSGILYFWPPVPLQKGDVEVSVLPSLIVMRGASHVHLSGLTFEMARGDALVISGGSGVVIENSIIRNVSGRAVVASGHRHKVVDADVYETGEGGIYLQGGDRKSLSDGGMSVETSRIRRFNRLSRTYRPAIQLGGVGNRAIGNIISDGTHSAILFYGNDHVIAFNEISKVATETGDVGAIYTGRDWTARGTVIRNNYLHDIHGPGLWGSRGVYLDDQASGITVRNNLFVRVDQPIFVGGGRDNVIEYNVIVASSPAIYVDARGLTWQRPLTNDANGTLQKKLREVPFDRPPYIERYPELARLLRDDPGAPKNNVIRRNIVIESQAPMLTEGAKRWVRIESLITTDSSVLRAGSSALKSEAPRDFGVEGSIGDSNRATIDGLDCLVSRWRLFDMKRHAPTCSLH